MKIQSTERGTNFFKSYLETTKLDRITRTGYALWGIYPVDSIVGIAQSDSEHCNGMHKIASDIPIFYPEIFSQEDAWKYHLLISIHEYGENALGKDIPDDGSQKHAKKIAKERNYIFGLIEKYYPQDYINTVKNLYLEFEIQNTYFGKTSYLIDKFDAILRGFAYEFYGRPGIINQKSHPTERDLLSAEFTRTVNLPDNWLCGLLQKTKNYPNIESFLEICQSAAFYIRNEPMLWLEQI